MLTGDVWSGAAERRRVARLLREAEHRDLRLELGRAQRQAVRPLRADIAAEAAATLPGGYGPVMAKSVRVTPLGGAGGDPVLKVRVFARGRSKHRDVQAIDQGRLRHPLFGNRGFWYNTAVRPGFVARPVDRLADGVVRESLDALDRVIAKIVRG